MERFHCCVFTFNNELIFFVMYTILKLVKKVIVVFFVVSAPHRSSQRLRPGHRAAAGERCSHGPARFRRMAGAARRGVLGSGTDAETGSRKLIRVLKTFLWFCCCCGCCFRCMWQSCWCLTEPAWMPRPSWKRPQSVRFYNRLQSTWPGLSRVSFPACCVSPVSMAHKLLQILCMFGSWVNSFSIFIIKRKKNTTSLKGIWSGSLSVILRSVWGWGVQNHPARPETQTWHHHEVPTQTQDLPVQANVQRRKSWVSSATCWLLQVVWEFTYIKCKTVH